jgi:hypothetical protein
MAYQPIEAKTEAIKGGFLGCLSHNLMDNGVLCSLHALWPRDEDKDE